MKKSLVARSPMAPVAFALSVLAGMPVGAAPIVYSIAGPNAAAITAERDSFRLDVGGGTVAGANGSFGGVRREINWDGVGDGFSAPNNLPLNFFNANSPRGAVFSTPGTGVQVSANPGVAPIEFDTVNPGYSNIFQTFSAHRLFSAIGSNVLDVSFFVPGTATPGATSAFASVFTDVDLLGATTIEFFSGTVSLGVFAAPTADNGLSFLGVRFVDGERVSRARIVSGNTALGPNDAPGVDVVAMDDFLFAQPLAVPEPSTLALLGGAVVAFGSARRRRRGSAARRTPG